MKTIYRIAKWIFGYKTKYQKKDSAYKRKSLSSKIFTIITMIALPLGTLAFGYFVVPLSFTHSFALIFLSCLLYIALVYETFQYLVMLGILGFRNMFISTVENIADKSIDKLETLIISENPQIEPQKNKQRYYRGIDLIIGILGTVLSIAFMILAILVGGYSIINTLVNLTK